MLQGIFSAVKQHAPGLLSVSFRRGKVPIQNISRKYTSTTPVVREQSYREYFFSTHFWGPLANWGFVLAVRIYFITVIIV